MTAPHMTAPHTWTIRHATVADLDALDAIESECFPPAEAASRETLRVRLQSYPECFWLLTKLLTDGEAIAAFINGFVTDRPDLADDMYDDAAQHDPHGRWQMIFGVDTAPQYQHHGYASMVMRQVIEDSRARGREGLVLTCKDRLVGFYAQFGFLDEGVSASVHGGVVWRQMRLTF
ncbi:GNAT family N-acetyltransferase [Bifidobacterium olomucense]|uniref:Acetyltransferase n=1 Tax=Bifidobacterium olomucense TaxID=2675324 RepID=A0A7Y0EY24_9BIFI|nr:GNAT family N-acetyltransferase [Bifidobacterium sp. DSM 109959]NMM98512.1 acetyltransferase [Bifidobacterium sp. DSM 109959]